MKQIILFLFFVGVTLTSWAQISFFSLYGEDEYDFGRDIVQTSDSGYLITGMSGSFRPGHADAFLLKINKNGFFEWSAPYGGLENDAANKLLLVENFGIYLVGSSNSWSSNGNADLYVAFTSENGDLIWEKTFPGDDWEDGVEAALTLDSGLIVGVNRTGNGTVGKDISLMRMDKLGDTVWTIDYALVGDDSITNIERYQDSLFLISSNRFNSDNSKLMAHLTMLHQDGQIVWEDTLGSGGGDYKINDFFISNDTMFAIGGHREFDSISSDIYYYRHLLDPLNHQIVQDWGVHSADEWEGDVYTNYLGTNMRYGAYRANGSWTSQGGPDLHIGRHAYTGGWQSGVGYVDFEGYDQMFSAIPTSDSGAVMVGFTSGGSGGASICVLKIGPGETYPAIQGVAFVNQLVGIYELPIETSTFVYPNPTEDFVTVNLKNMEEANFSVVGLDGVKYDEGVFPANGKIFLGDLNAGVYLIQIMESERLISTARVIVR